MAQRLEYLTRWEGCLRVTLVSGRMRGVVIRARFFFLLFLILWQSAVAFAPVALAQRAEQLQHMTMHGKAIGHHHHDDASLHLEESGLAAQHQHADGSVGNLGLVASADLAVLPVRGGAPPTAGHSEFPNRFLDGLLRPPRAAA